MILRNSMASKNLLKALACSWIVPFVLTEPLGQGVASIALVKPQNGAKWGFADFQNSIHPLNSCMSLKFMLKFPQSKAGNISKKAAFSSLGSGRRRLRRMVL